MFILYTYILILYGFIYRLLHNINGTSWILSVYEHGKSATKFIQILLVYLVSFLFGLFDNVLL